MLSSLSYYHVWIYNPCPIIKGPYFEQATSQSLNHSSTEPKVRRFSDGNDQHLTGNSKQYAKEEIKFETENFRTKFSHLKNPKVSKIFSKMFLIFYNDIVFFRLVRIISLTFKMETFKENI